MVTEHATVHATLAAGANASEAEAEESIHVHKTKKPEILSEKPPWVKIVGFQQSKIIIYI